MELQPLAQGNLSSRAYDALREALISGRFHPGQRLVMQDLAGMLGTSVTPAREACLRLVSERALEMRSGRFVTVPDMTLERYLEVRTIRIALEGLATELATDKIAASDLEHLKALQADYETLEETGDLDKIAACNREFHFGVYRLSGLPLLISYIENLWVSMGPVLAEFHNFRQRQYVGAGQHVELLKALRRRDRDAARAAMIRDLELGGEDILRFLKHNP